MSDSKSPYYIDEKWDAALDTILRQTVYGFLGGGLAAIVIFRGPCARASVTSLGAGFGAGSAFKASEAMVSEVLRNPHHSHFNSRLVFAVC